MNLCPVCNNEKTGRSDQRFCSAKCKSLFHFSKSKKEEAFYYEVDKQLKTNRRLLKKYNMAGLETIRKEKLIEEGFNPNYFTHYWKNSKGQVYLFVYDYGYEELNKEGKKKYLLVKWQDYMNE